MEDLAPQDMKLLRWSEIMPRGGGGQQMHFHLLFFGLLCQQLIFVDDYAYVGIDFRGDPDLPLPPSE